MCSRVRENAETLAATTSGTAFSRTRLHAQSVAWSKSGDTLKHTLPLLLILWRIDLVWLWDNVLDMSEPKIAAKAPAGVELEEGKKYFFCTCGESSDQPFCDGSHRGTDFAPQAFVAEKTGTAYLCQCKRTVNAPFCDGSHASL